MSKSLKNTHTRINATPPPRAHPLPPKHPPTLLPHPPKKKKKKDPIQIAQGRLLSFFSFNLTSTHKNKLLKKFKITISEYKKFPKTKLVNYNLNRYPMRKIKKFCKS
jgi:hypothetical protein